MAESAYEFFPCCGGCCPVADDDGVPYPDICAFNRVRDRHTSPCDTCEPEAYAAWDAAHPPAFTKDLDVPF